MTPAPLTPKQQRFVEEYLKDLNGTQAAIRAGYSRKTANEQAARLLAKASVATAVTVGKLQQNDRIQVEADQVREQNAYLALADPIDVLDEHGQLLPLRQMPRRIRCAIRSIELMRRNVTAGDGQTDLTYKIQFWDKSKAIELEYKYFGMLVDRHEVSGPNGRPLQLGDLQKMSDEELDARLEAAYLKMKEEHEQAAKAKT